MEHPERPSRHKKLDKWKRIIEPAGDSDSSEWSSDSDVVVSTTNTPQTYRQFELALGSSTSSNGAREQHSPHIFPSPSTSSQTKNSREQCSSLFRSLGGCGLMFEPLGTKRFEGLEPGAGPPPTNFNHLLHHDYAEREINNERGNGDARWLPMYNSFALTLKKKWFDPASTSTAGPDDVILPEPENPSNMNTVENQNSDEDRYRGYIAINRLLTDYGHLIVNNEESGEEEQGRWRNLPNCRPILSSPARKRPMLESLDVPPNPPPHDAPDMAIPGCSTMSPMQNQPGPNDGASTSSSIVQPLQANFFTPADWYVQKKVQSRCKQVRFSDGYTPSGEPVLGDSVVAEDYSLPAGRTSEDASEIQVLSMAGPSSSSRIVYPSSTRHMPSLEEAPVLDEPPTNVGVSNIGDGEDESVEVIMVDDSQAEVSNTSLPPVSQQQQQQQQQQPQPSAVPEQQFALPSLPKVEQDDDLCPPSKKKLRSEDDWLNQGLIGLLECPVCMEYMGPPIHQCRRGHLVCSSCKPKLPSCPTCRSRFTESRNLAMEKVADKLRYPCKNAHVGCTTTLRLRDKDDHEANCVYRSFKCVMVPPCEWRGRQQDILNHVKQMHPNTLLQGPEQVLEMRLGDFTEQSSQNWIISALGELFRVNIGAVRGGRVQVFGCVLFLGPSRLAPLYRYTLTVGPAEGDVARRTMSYSRTTHCYVERCSVYYSAGDSFHLRTESAQLFSAGPVSDRVMSVRLKLENAI